MKIFVCFTPLHVLIAKKIIEKESINSFIFIYMTDLDTPKNRFYYEVLSERAINAHYIVLQKRLLSDLKSLHTLKKGIEKNFHTSDKIVYYTGKIKSFHVRYLMYLTGFDSFITFDDGSGNVSGGGYFYDSNENALFKIFFQLTNKNLLYRNLKRSMKRHYTIYKSPNVFPRTHYLELFTHKTQAIAKKKKEKMTLLLTNAFAEDGEMELEKEIKLYKKIIDKYEVTHISKHPREKFKKIENDAIIELKSRKISEELIFDLTKNYDITVIGIYSTTLLNLANIPNLKLINIDVELKKPTKTLAKLLLEENIENQNI